MEMVLIWKRRI